MNIERISPSEFIDIPSSLNEEVYICFDDFNSYKGYLTLLRKVDKIIITHIYVKEEYRNKGIGYNLLNYVIIKGNYEALIGKKILHP